MVSPRAPSRHEKAPKWQRMFLALPSLAVLFCSLEERGEMDPQVFRRGAKLGESLGQKERGGLMVV